MDSVKNAIGIPEKNFTFSFRKFRFSCRKFRYSCRKINIFLYYEDFSFWNSPSHVCFCPIYFALVVKTIGKALSGKSFKRHPKKMYPIYLINYPAPSRKKRQANFLTRPRRSHYPATSSVSNKHKTSLLINLWLTTIIAQWNVSQGFVSLWKTSSDKMILQIFDIFSHKFGLLSTQLTLFRP